MDRIQTDTPGKTSRIEARVNPETRSLLKRAAELQGRTLSDFVISAARATALETIETMETIRLARDAQAVFVEQLLAPPKPNEALRRASDRHTDLIGSA